MEPDHLSAIAAHLRLSPEATRIYQHLARHIIRTRCYVAAPGAIGICSGVQVDLVEAALTELEAKIAITKSETRDGLIRIAFPWVDAGVSVETYVDQLLAGLPR